MKEYKIINRDTGWELDSDTTYRNIHEIQAALNEVKKMAENG